jgi:uncharacterized protein (TIGR00106 family)
MAMIEVSIVPVGTGKTSVSPYVARALKILQQEHGIKYELTAMGTIIEGELPRILELARKMHDSAFGDGVARVVTTIIIDDRRDKPSTMKSKVESVKKEMAQ